MNPRSFLIVVLLAAFVGASAPPAGASGGEDDDWVRTTGEILQIALPAGAGLMTLFTNPDPDATWDREGTLQFAKTFGAAWGSAYVLEILASKARSNGANRRRRSGVRPARGTSRSATSTSAGRSARTPSSTR